jgi:hypothetical protein
VGVDKITSSLGSSEGKNLVIAFPYEEGSIEKVSYNIDGGYFNLVIEPREGYPLITQDSLRYSFSGGTTDLIVTVGVSSIETLGQIYQANSALFQEKTVVSIDTNSAMTPFGKTTIVDPAVTLSELMLDILTQMGATIDPDTATNLLMGIVAATNNFTTASPATFETVASLMRSGARMMAPPPATGPMPNFNKPTQAQRPQPAAPKPQPTPRPQVQPAQNRPAWQPPAQSQSRPTPQTQQPLRKPYVPPSMPPRQPAPQAHQPAAATHTTAPAPTHTASHDAPPDWLKPKIFKGSGSN